MSTKIAIAYDVPDNKIAEIRAFLAETAAKNPQWNGANFQLIRDDFTEFVDNESPDAASLMREIFYIIKGD